MEISKITYTGELRTESVHLASGMQIVTDAPKDNYGRGEAFSPTDLLSTSLCCCAMTIMGIEAKKTGLLLVKMEASVEKFMASDPRRVAKIKIKVLVHGSAYFSDAQKKHLENAALNCPVAKSLHPDLIQEFEFGYC